MIFTISRALSGGSRKTAQFADKHGKPWVHIAKPGDYTPEKDLLDFVSANGIKALNVAGSRESKESGAYEFVKATLEGAFFPRPGVTWLGGQGEG